MIGTPLSFATSSPAAELFIFPVVPTVLAEVDSAIGDDVLRRFNLSGLEPALFPSTEPQQQAREKEANPKGQVNKPPPPANEQPPEDAVPLLLILRLHTASGHTALLLLEQLIINVRASAPGTSAHSGRVYGIHSILSPSLL